MKDLNRVIENYDFYHCIEREGYIFTAVTEPANVLDAIVIRKPENSSAISPKLTFSFKTLEEHIDFINKYKIEKACVIAENIDFLVKCPSLKYLRIIPARSAKENFDYSPLYKMPEIKYLMVDTEYGEYDSWFVTTIDYSQIKGLLEVWIDGKGHENYNQIDTVEEMYISNLKIDDLTGLRNCKKLKKLDLMKTKIKSLNGIEHLSELQQLNLDYERVLYDVSDIIKTADTLRYLSIYNCPKITDFSFLHKMVNLEYLDLNGKNILSDLHFLKEMPRLKGFNFSMEIADGDLTPCLKIPYVDSQKNRKGYNLKNKDLPKNHDKKGFKLI